MTTLLETPATAGEFIDTILRTKTGKVQRRQEKLYGAEQSKAIRELFRELGWSKFFRVTKGCWSLGPSIEWAKGYAPAWYCDETMAQLEAQRHSNTWMDVRHCACPTCQHRQAQRDAVSRRVHHALNQAFGNGEREFGNRSDTQSDYFDSDYTFHP